MLVQSCRITRLFHCPAHPEKIGIIAEGAEEIYEAFSCLNATIKECLFNHPALTLTSEKGEWLITLHANHIPPTKRDDEKEAEKILKWLQDLVNETDENRDKIQPGYTMRQELKPTDSKGCGLLSCQALLLETLRHVGRSLPAKPSGPGGSLLNRPGYETS